MGKPEAATIGQRLRDLRGDRTTQEVADLLGVAVSTVGMYERGERVPKDDVKIRIASLYGKTVQEIFFDQE
ncbi:MAG: helix-turn-helix transcriptional regulator [Oscillospiraceae bacterium]|nr:helix-turn-helix transcriptional regulator [Oscillospiraceae bacterium]